jgi:hypothetical protein
MYKSNDNASVCRLLSHTKRSYVEVPNAEAGIIGEEMIA